MPVVIKKLTHVRFTSGYAVIRQLREEPTLIAIYRSLCSISLSQAEHSSAYPRVEMRALSSAIGISFCPTKESVLGE